MMKKPRAAASLVVSANHTLTGLAIYRTPAGTWSTAIGEALVFAAQLEPRQPFPPLSPTVPPSPWIPISSRSCRRTAVSCLCAGASASGWRVPPSRR